MASVDRSANQPSRVRRQSSWSLRSTGGVRASSSTRAMLISCCVSGSRS